MSSPADNFSDEVSNMELLERAKNEFNREKRVIIKHLPTDTTDKDVRVFMESNGEIPVEDVQMVKNSNQAVVTLKDPSLVDYAICKLENTELASHIVSVSKYHSTKMLCIAHLPPDITEYKFRELVLEYGSVDRCFLMRSEETGESKGYGFVEYNEPIERVGQIKCLLDWMEIDEHIVHCDAIVDSAKAGFTFSDLHSKCLLIDNLPSDYNDSIALRELFSELVKPLYCQIVAKEGESLGFGIIEYDNATDAENTYRKFNKHPINGIEMNISYCIPGKSAVHMFNRIMFKYGDRVHVNRASLLPEPVYPNPAFLRHPFFKIHVSKHPRLLVQFTDDLLHLQAGYVKSLEHKTNAKPGILGPAPSIPMSPLMDVNLQLGLLSLIVLDMKEKKTYIGEIPAPLGKLKLPADDEFQQKPEPVSLLGDPLTAQANMILKNLLMPLDKIEGKQDAKTEVVDENDARLLGKPVHELNLIYLCSLGRIMAMMSEKNQMMGILGCAPTGPPKPLMEGLMQVGKVAQSLLTSMGIGPQNQANPMNMSQLELSKQQGLLGNPPNFNQMSQGSSNFMNSVKAMAFRNMSENEGGNSQLMNMFNNSRGNSNSGDGLLGSYQGQGSSFQNQGQSLLGKPPQPLLSLNLNKGDGLMPTPQLEEEDGSYGFYGNQGSEYQGGFGGENFGNNSNQMMRTGSWRGQGGNKGVGVGQEMDTLGNANRFEGAYFPGINARQRTGKGQLEKKDGQYNNISQPAATYCGGSVAAATGYQQQQYDEYRSSVGYPNNEYQDGNFTDNSYQVAEDNGLNVGGRSSSQGILGAYNDRSNLAYSSFESSSSVNTNANAPMRPAGDYSNNMARSNQGFGGQVKREGVNTGRLFGSGMLPPPTAAGSILGAGPSNINSTPQGQKRSYVHVLPSPEPSPEGDYIGQHSQGIGGHYADTYAKRQKLSGRF